MFFSSRLSSCWPSVARGKFTVSVQKKKKEEEEREKLGLKGEFDAEVNGGKEKLELLQEWSVEIYLKFFPVLHDDFFLLPLHVHMN